VFSSHTQIHSWFMVRTVSLPIALGWTVLAVVIYDHAFPAREHRLDAPGRAVREDSTTW
jgi:hypothetical protein